MPSYAVIGASRGLGYEWLHQLSNDPSNTVVGLARTPDKVVSRLTSDSISNVHVLQADMADSKSLTAAAAEAEKITDGSLDYLIINGVYINSEEHMMSPSEFIGKEDLITHAMIESLKVNVLGVIFSINSFLPLIRKSNIKKIVVISSVLSDLDLTLKSQIQYFVTYSSMKAALNMVVARYAAELRPEGIIVFSLSPGVVDTSEDKPQANVDPEERVRIIEAGFKLMDPHFSGSITTTQSVAMQKKVIENTTIEQSGSFLSHHGNKEWLD
ncbi:hypothetical protein F5884DRAFT_342608 [Xylogone sp. PMI_703]|nr:hypothetical protein F5884DRAFT_342608 [Xylogone sp. PMI_703]